MGHERRVAEQDGPQSTGLVPVPDRDIPGLQRLQAGHLSRPARRGRRRVSCGA